MNSANRIGLALTATCSKKKQTPTGEDFTNNFKEGDVVRYAFLFRLRNRKNQKCWKYKQSKQILWTTENTARKTNQNQKMVKTTKLTPFAVNKQSESWFWILPLGPKLKNVHLVKNGKVWERKNEHSLLNWSNAQNLMKSDPKNAKASNPRNRQFRQNIKATFSKLTKRRKRKTKRRRFPKCFNFFSMKIHPFLKWKLWQSCKAESEQKRSSFQLSPFRATEDESDTSEFGEGVDVDEPTDQDEFIVFDKQQFCKKISMVLFS